MDIAAWEKRYRSGERSAEDFDAEPTPLAVETATRLKPGRALDLACGTGRNSIWLAEQGWSVTAIDGANAAIEELRRRAAERKLKIDAQVADLERHEFNPGFSTWELVSICYYLQRDLFELAKRATIRGGILLAIVHIAEPGEEPTEHRLKPGELERYFADWEILHRYEGKPADRAHHRAVAEIAARRPARETPKR